MKRLLASTFSTPYRWVLICCLLLAGWALWSGGIFDSQLASTMRGSSVYADSAYHLDTAAAQQVIGNRRLAVVFLDTADSTIAADTCKDLHRAADGALVVIVYAKDGELKNYGCSLLPGAGDDKNFGKSFVAESEIATGISGFLDAPLDAVKTMAIKYDALAQAEIVPQDARVFQVSAPRYLLALTAIGAVIVGAALVYVSSRRAGRAIADSVDETIAEGDEQVDLNATMAGIAGTILQVDGRFSAPGDESAGWLADYRKMATDYTALAADIARHAEEKDTEPASALVSRASALAERAAALAGTRSAGD